MILNINITKEDVEALETGYALMEGYCLDDDEENDNWIKQRNRFKKIIDKCNKVIYK